MKNKLDAYRNMFELSFQKNNNTFKLSPTKTIYNNAYSATFDVVSTTPKRDITLFAAHVASIEIMQKAAQGSSSLDTAPNPEKVTAALKKLKKFKHDTNQNDVVEAITDMGLRVLKYEEFAYKKDEKVKEEQNATKVEKQKIFRVQTLNDEFESKAVIVATGNKKGNPFASLPLFKLKSD